MHNFELFINSKTIRNSNYRISRSSKIETFIRDEYRNCNVDEYNHYIYNQDNKKNNITSIIETIIKTDSYIKVPLGSEGHMYFTTEYNHTLPEDSEHNIIISKEDSYNGRSK